MPLDAATCAPLVPVRDANGHKGTFGTLVCVCGSLDYVGAGLLCGLAAARAGAGLVALAVPVGLQWTIAGRVPELVTIALQQSPMEADLDAPAALDLLDRRRPDALVFGCGLAETDGYRALLLALLATSGAPIVIDGGGLSLLARSSGWWSSVARACVLTPHPGEFARLTGAEVGAGDTERLRRAEEAAQRFGQVVVLKGARTVVAAPDGRAAVAPFANAALATAGSGDVLAGTIGSLMAQGVDPFDAACLGVYLHGRAAERLSERLGDSGLLASDLPYEIALARRELVAQRA